MPTLLLLLLLAPEAWTFSMIVGPNRPYKTIPAAIQSRLPLQENLTIFVEVPTSTYTAPHSITPNSTDWNGFEVYIQGMKSAPEVVGYVEDMAVYEFIGDRMEMHHDNVVGTWGTEGRFEAGRYKMYFDDHLGSTRMTVDEGGAYNEVTLYNSYGTMFQSTVGPVGTREKFTGKEYDGNEGMNLSYFGARYYDADLGLWISPDAAREFHSPYAYHPNPLSNVDPDGNASIGVGATFSGTYGPAGAHLSWGLTFDTDALGRGDFRNALFVDGAVGAGARLGFGASSRVRLSYSPDAPKVGRSQSMSREVIAGKGVVFGIKESFDMESSNNKRSLEISAGLGEEWAGGITAEVKDTKTFGSFIRELFTGRNDERLK